VPQNLTQPGADAFTSPPKEGMLPILESKIHRPWPGVKPRTLPPMASTLNSRPPRVNFKLNSLNNIYDCTAKQKKTPSFTITKIK
jgi:hypothetical protein